MFLKRNALIYLGAARNYSAHGLTVKLTTMGLGWAGSGGHYELTLRFARREAGSFGTVSYTHLTLPTSVTV